MAQKILKSSSLEEKFSIFFISSSLLSLLFWEVKQKRVTVDCYCSGFLNASQPYECQEVKAGWWIKDILRCFCFRIETESPGIVINDTEYLSSLFPVEIQNLEKRCFFFVSNGQCDLLNLGQYNNSSSKKSLSDDIGRISFLAFNETTFNLPFYLYQSSSHMIANIKLMCEFIAQIIFSKTCLFEFVP